MKKTNALIILDGFGYAAESHGNAVDAAGTPNFSALEKMYPHTLIEASGRAVGLPQGQMGNSEVGHLNLGAGRIVYQDITRIDKSIEDGDFFTNPAFVNCIDEVNSKGKALHLVGLTSNGGVHSSLNHLFALISLAKRKGVRKLCVHCITDGRDTPPDSGKHFVSEVQEKLREEGIGNVCTVVGRYYYMDRDNRWERVKEGYDGVFAGIGNNVDNVLNGIESAYAAGITDEFIKPIILKGYDGVKEGDGMIFFNFRSDRAREITQAAIYEEFDKFERVGGYKKISYVGMTQYDCTFSQGIETAFAPKEIKNTLGEYLGSLGLSQTRVAETEKYAHVTFFFNGGVEQPNVGEERILVPSPKVATYDLVPEMSAYEVTRKAIEAVGKTDVLIMNYANCDMVGHTGVFDSTVKAVKTVDECFYQVVQEVLKSGGNVIVTADHGNAEQMFDGEKPMTAHTTNKVKLIVAGLGLQGKSLRSGGALCDVAPTLLELMNVPQPKEMEGKSLLC